MFGFNFKYFISFLFKRNRISSSFEIANILYDFFMIKIINKINFKNK